MPRCDAAKRPVVAPAWRRLWQLGGSVAGNEVEARWRRQLSFSLAAAVGAAAVVISAQQQRGGGKQRGNGVRSAVLAAAARWWRQQRGGKDPHWHRLMYDAVLPNITYRWGGGALRDH